MSVNKSISVCLSGSGFRFISHIGALQAILDLGYIITDIAGASGGAIVSSFYAYGLTPEQMFALTIHAPLSSFTKLSLWSLIKQQSWSNGNKLYSWINDQLHSAKFSDIKMPLTVVSTDLNTCDSYVFSQKSTPNFNVALANRASSAIPLVFAPVLLDNKYLVDGGLANDLPVNYLTGVTKIAVDLVENASLLTSKSNVFSIIGKLVDTVLDTNIDYSIINITGLTLIKVVTPPGLSLDSSLSLADIEALYKVGYSTTKAALIKAT